MVRIKKNDERKKIFGTRSTFSDVFSQKIAIWVCLSQSGYSCACEGEQVWEHVAVGGRSPAGSAGRPGVGGLYAGLIESAVPLSKSIIS